MPTGKVRFYDEEKGFGFITTDDGQDVFLHATALPAGVEGLKAGTRLDFGVADGKRGLQALAVRVLFACFICVPASKRSTSIECSSVSVRRNLASEVAMQTSGDCSLFPPIQPPWRTARS